MMCVQEAQCLFPDRSLNVQVPVQIKRVVPSQLQKKATLGPWNSTFQCMGPGCNYVHQYTEMVRHTDKAPDECRQYEDVGRTVISRTLDTRSTFHHIMAHFCETCMGPSNRIGFERLNPHLPQELLEAMLARDGDRVWDALPTGVPIWTTKCFETIQVPMPGRKATETISQSWRPRATIKLIQHRPDTVLQTSRDDYLDPPLRAHGSHEGR